MKLLRLGYSIIKGVLGASRFVPHINPDLTLIKNVVNNKIKRVHIISSRYSFNVSNICSMLREDVLQTCFYFMKSCTYLIRLYYLNATSNQQFKFISI